MRTEIVAEIGNAHNGDLGRALRLLDAAKACGATAVKFQCYTPDELVELRGDGPAPEPWGSDGWTMRTLYQKAATPHEWFPVLKAYCGTIGLPWFSSVFGAESLALLQSLDCPRYKIAALDRHSRMYRMLVATGKPLLVSTPDIWADFAASIEYSAAAVLLCPPGYPQPHAHLSTIRRYHGYSYHGTDPMVPALAVAAGAKLVECHFMLDAEPCELEAGVSLGEAAFREMVAMIAKVEALW
jgi:sialic acid synthase SpsE